MRSLGRISVEWRLVLTRRRQVSVGVVGRGGTAALGEKAMLIGTDMKQKREKEGEREMMNMSGWVRANQDTGQSS